MTQVNTERAIRILLLNPNSSKSMTDGMEAAARTVPSDLVQIDTITASGGPASIDNDHDLEESDKVVLDDFRKSDDLRSGKYDAILVACFSVNELVVELTRWSPTVTGIFEASVMAALSVIRPRGAEKWGIVTTGKFWEKHLTEGVEQFLGYAPGNGGENHTFAGVYSTGLNAGDFHHVSPEEVKAKLKEATTKLLTSGNVTCVVMGCGGMAGLEDIIRSTAADVYDKKRAESLYIVDGVKAGILQLEQTIRSKRLFT